MPLYEFQCRACGHEFEILVRGTGQPACPSCQGQDLERLLSLFGVSSEERSHTNLQAQRRVFSHDGNRRDKLRHEHEEYREHIQEDHGIILPKPKD